MDLDDSFSLEFRQFPGKGARINAQQCGEFFLGHGKEKCRIVVSFLLLGEEEQDFVPDAPLRQHGVSPQQIKSPEGE